MDNIIEDCQDVSIYLGDVCNFNCTYCDRDYIKDTIGGQKMSADDVPAILEFFHALSINGVLPVDMIASTEASRLCTSN